MIGPLGTGGASTGRFGAWVDVQAQGLLLHICAHRCGAGGRRDPRRGLRQDRRHDKCAVYVVGMSLAVVGPLGTFVENHLAERARLRARERAIRAETELALLSTTVLPAIAKSLDALRRDLRIR